MKIFIDSADIEEIKEAFSWGIVDGVTTNPSLIKKAIEGKEKEGEKKGGEEGKRGKGEGIEMADGRGMAGYIEELLKTAEGCPVSLEVDGESGGMISEEQMVKEARQLYERFRGINLKVNIKIPVNPAMGAEEENQWEGLQTIKRLSKEGIPVNATLIMTPEQALLAAKAGAAYISPFMGRIDDYVKARQGAADKGIQSGIELIREVEGVLKPYNFNVEVIAASIRNAEQVREAAKAGVSIATIPFKVLKEMIAHEKTYEGVRRFKEDMVKEYQALLRG